MFTRILVPVDGSEPSKQALNEALDLAKSFSAKVFLLHVSQLPVSVDLGYGMAGSGAIADAMAQAGKVALDEAGKLAAAAGVNVESKLAGPEIGAVSQSIVDYANSWGADLIVMGTHGRRGLDHLMLGSVAERVLRTTPVPVLMIRPKAPGETRK